MTKELRIAVVRALAGIGDMLCIVPTLVSLRLAHPNARVTLIGVDTVRPLMRRFNGLVDEYLPFPGFPGIPEVRESRDALTRFVSGARTRHFDLALQMHGSGLIMNAFVALLGAREAAGFYPVSRDTPPSGRFYTYPERGAEALRWLSLGHALGWPAVSAQAVFPVTAADRHELATHPRLAGLAHEPFVCVHAGARDPARRWPANRFAALGDALARHGFRIVLTGTANERAVGEAVASAMKHPAVNVVGETSLGAAAALLERARLVVTNDTGVSHLAAAVATPSVVVFLASEPDRWAPIDRDRHRCVVSSELAASATRQMRVSRSPMPATAEVLEEARAALAIQVAPCSGAWETGQWPLQAHGH